MGSPVADCTKLTEIIANLDLAAAAAPHDLDEAMQRLQAARLDLIVWRNELRQEEAEWVAFADREEARMLADEAFQAKLTQFAVEAA
jgi:hypothetical protein